MLGRPFGCIPDRLGVRRGAGAWEKREAVLLTRLEHLIEEAEWTVAKHGVSPHEYVLKKEAPELFVEMRAFIKKNGYYGKFLGRVYFIGEIGDYRYWYMSEGSESIILNRALRSTPGVERLERMDCGSSNLRA